MLELGSVTEQLRFEYGFDDLDKRALDYVVKLHKGEIDLSMNMIHPAALNYAADFAHRVQYGTNCEVYTIPVGSSLVNWILDGALTGKYTDIKNDIDMLTFIRGDESEKVDLMSKMVFVNDQMRREGVKFCKINSASDNILDLDTFSFSPEKLDIRDYSDVLNIKTIFEETYRDILRFVQLYPIYGDLKDDFEYYLHYSIEELGILHPKYDLEFFNFGNDLINNPPSLVSPIKYKHIGRIRPDLSPEEINSLLGVFKDLGMNVIFEE